MPNRKANTHKTYRVGVIAEDFSDIDVLKELMPKLTDKHFALSPFVGEGCGRILGKCRGWAMQLRDRGCRYLIIIHDLDERNRDRLEDDIRKALAPSPLSNNAVVIPVKEMEAWLLADEKAIHKAMKLKKRLKQISNPEAINDPKKKLGEIVSMYSDHRSIYLNTVDNKKIAKECSISRLSLTVS